MSASVEFGFGSVSAALSSTVFSVHSFVVLAALVFAYLVASSVYSLTLHPLADIPGPKLCAISRIPYWVEHMQGKDVRWIHNLHQKCGAMVRFGPGDLSYNTGTAWKDINGYRKGKMENLRAPEIHLQPVNGTTQCRCLQHSTDVVL